MNYTGLYNPFKLNRPLNEEDIKYQLRQDFSGMGASGSMALDDATVIKMNSTYLEVVDKYYIDRGMLEFFTVVMFLCFLFIAAFLLYFIMYNPVNSEKGISDLFLELVMFIASLAMVFWFSGFLVFCVSPGLPGLIIRCDLIVKQKWFIYLKWVVQLFQYLGKISSLPAADLFLGRRPNGVSTGTF